MDEAMELDEHSRTGSDGGGPGSSHSVPPDPNPTTPGTPPFSGMDKLPVPDEQLMAEDSMPNDIKPPPNVPVMIMAPMNISSAIPEEALVSMPLLEQTGLVVVGSGARKEAQLLGLGLPVLSSRQRDDLNRAKKYAMEQSVKQVLMKQTVAHQQNQQKVAMYAQALSLMARVYIGSISFEVREEQIKNAFQPFGPIKSINMSWDAITGHHKGFAFLEYEVPEAALLAQESMNGVLMGGRNIKVAGLERISQTAVGRPSNMPQAQPIIEMVMEEAKDYHRVYVASVHPDLSEVDLKSVFEAFGNVLNCQLAKQSVHGKGHRGFGYIEFDRQQSAQEAIASMNMFDLGGQYLRVGKCITPPEALTYVVPTSVVSLPTAAAVAAAAVTAQIQAIEVTAGSNPVQAQGTGQAPKVMMGDTTMREADRRDAQNLAMKSGQAVFSVPPPGLAMPFATSTSRDGSRSTSPAGGGSAGSSPVPRSRGFGGFVPNAPPPSVVVVSTPAPGLITPQVSTGRLPMPSDNFAMSAEPAPINPNAKLPRPQQVTVGMNARPTPKAPAYAMQAAQGSLAITDGSMTGDEGAVVAVGGGPSSYAQGYGRGAVVAAGGVKKKKPKKKKTKDAIPSQKVSASAVNAVRVAQAISSELSEVVADKQKDTEIGDNASLAQQENLEIRGNDARHMLMHKLMRVNRSSVIVLRNMVTVEEMDEELEVEIREECSKYGKVEEVVISQEHQGDDSNAAVVVKIFVRFSEPAESECARQALDKRFFAGRQISALIYDQLLFDHNDLTG